MRFDLHTSDIVIPALARWQRSRAITCNPVALRSILFVELTRLGDVVAMLPALAAMRKHYPQSTLSVAVDARYAPLFQFLPMIDRVHGLAGTGSAQGLFRSISALREEETDLVCSMSPAKRNSMVALSVKARGRVGYFQPQETMTPFLHRTPVESMGFPLTREVAYERENIALRGEKICAALELPLTTLPPRWEIPENAASPFLAGLAAAGYTPDRLLVVIHPFAGWKYREWPIERFIALAKILTVEYNAWVVVSGLPEEWSGHEAAAQKLSSMRHAHRFSSSDIRELALLLHAAHLFIGNDTGPLHLASSLGTPTVGLFGPASPALTGTAPPGDPSLYHQLECSPCAQLRCTMPEHPCMQRISFDEVLRAVEKRLERISDLERAC